MRYQRVCIESLGYSLPEEVITSDEIERRLTPAYERLRLPAGRLELMSGIRERRFFPPGTLPSDVSKVSARRALEASGLAPDRIGALIHGSVCRDVLEPATACAVHEAVGLGPDCVVHDVSNACLGILTGMVHVANMIELGQIEAGIVVGTECGRTLVENTIRLLNEDESITRREIKQFVASLTIGSASAAVLLCSSGVSRTGNRLLAARAVAHTDHNTLCRSDGMEEFMRTDSEQLMRRGVATAAETFDGLLGDLGWETGGIQKTVCHQVGSAHRKLLFDRLGLSPELDFSTFETLGNTGAAALPTTLAIAAENGRLVQGNRVALMGIGSGINCQMIGVDWQEQRVSGGVWTDRGASRPEIAATTA